MSYALNQMKKETKRFFKFFDTLPSTDYLQARSALENLGACFSQANFANEVEREEGLALLSKAKNKVIAHIQLSSSICDESCSYQ